MVAGMAAGDKGFSAIGAGIIFSGLLKPFIDTALHDKEHARAHIHAVLLEVGIG